MAKNHFKETGPKILLLMPALLFFMFAMLIPFFFGLNVAFTSWDGISPDMKYVGTRNFVNILSNDDIIIPIKNTLYYGIVLTICNNILSLAIALALNSSFKGRNFLRMVYFLPTALSTVLASFIWSFIYREVFHTLFGINSLLGGMKTAIPGIIGIALWNGIGINMLIYLSALSGVPTELYEAAIVDGAGKWRRFRNVTIPMIVPAFTVCVTLTLTYGLREFALPMTATNGGPARSSETVAIYIYNHMFSFNKAGYGQAVAILFMILLLVIGAVVSKFFRNREVEL